MELQCSINGEAVCLTVAPDRRLLDILRDDLNLTGTKEGCGEGECGACTVLVNGKPVHACLTLAAQLGGCEIITIEGLEKSGELDLLQRCFVEETAIQCGYCTTGMIMATKGLLLENPHPTNEKIRVAISGNICRCSGYTQIIRAVERAAQEGGAQQ